MDPDKFLRDAAAELPRADDFRRLWPHAIVLMWDKIREMVMIISQVSADLVKHLAASRALMSTVDRVARNITSALTRGLEEWRRELRNQKMLLAQEFGIHVEKAVAAIGSAHQSREKFAKDSPEVRLALDSLRRYHARLVTQENRLSERETAFEAERRTWEAERRVWDAERRTWEAERRVWEAECRTWEAERRVWDAERRDWEAERRVWDAERRDWEAECRASEAKRHRIQTWLQRVFRWDH